MYDQRVFNFSAGPANLPESVLNKIQEQMLNYNGAGMSVMEMSHRSSYFMEIMEKTEAQLRELLSISDDYAVLFLQGGASLQFSMAAQNLAVPGKAAQLVNTGSWTQKAIKEIKRHSELNVIASSEDKNFSYIPKVTANDFDDRASFAYIASNNTIFGTQWESFPSLSIPLVADMSSDILCRPLPINDFGLIFAGAQKNLGPAGVTLVIVRRDLLNRSSSELPTMLNYSVHADKGSMYNTPPTFSIYVVGLVLEWLMQMGGLERMESLNREKANLLYTAIDESEFFYTPTEDHSRSIMNVVFRITGDREDLEAEFVKSAKEAGMDGLKGHRSVGGLRASIYNAHPRKGVERLVDFMRVFEKEHKTALAHSN